jgi:uncharacterized cupin superfamily protein
VPKIDIEAIAWRKGSSYPVPFGELVAGRMRRRLGDAGGLTQFGVNLTRLAPGSASSQRHWHENEDELVFILEGEACLIEDGGETLLRAGDAAAFKAGVADGHQLINRSDQDVVLLEIGTRAAREQGHYSDIDMKVVVDETGTRFVHRDGSPYK